jgi:hypothetical protein
MRTNRRPLPRSSSVGANNASRAAAMPGNSSSFIAASMIDTSPCGNVAGVCTPSLARKYTRVWPRPISQATVACGYAVSRM